MIDSRLDLLRYAKDLAIDGNKITVNKASTTIDQGIVLHSYVARIVVNSESVTGYGSAFSEEQALISAVAELLERCCFVTQEGLHCASGFAVHSTFEEASFHAALELIERDQFMCYYLTATPICDFTAQAAIESHEFSIVRNYLANRGSDLRLGIMHHSKNFSAVICICLDPINNMGCILGASCKKDLKDAINKSLSEVLVNYLAVQNEHFKVIEAEDFQKKSSVTLDDHFQVGLSSKSGNIMRNLLKIGAPCQTDEGQYFSSMQILELCPPNSLENMPLKICRSFNPDLQEMRFGQLKVQHVNLKRLQQFSKQDIKFEDLQRHPHPFD